jgi:hypothetical protein
VVLGNSLSQVDDLADELVSDHSALAHPWGLAVEQMKVGCADGGLLHCNERVSLFLDLRLGNVVDLHAGAGEHHGSHGATVWLSCPGLPESLAMVGRYPELRQPLWED